MHIKNINRVEKEEEFVSHLNSNWFLKSFLNIRVFTRTVSGDY